MLHRGACEACRCACGTALLCVDAIHAVCVHHTLSPSTETGLGMQEGVSDLLSPPPVPSLAQSAAAAAQDAAQSVAAGVLGAAGAATGGLKSLQARLLSRVLLMQLQFSC